MPRVYWSAEAVRILSTLPEPVQDEVLSKATLLAEFPQMCPVRRRGRYRGQRFLIAFEWIVYYVERHNSVVMTTVGHARRRGA
jgi:mRNA-degrading endonuclease RelE of RelBE toxin-antitoxin system